MQVQLKALDLNDFFDSLRRDFNAKLFDKGFELVAVLPKTAGKGEIFGYNCGAGFTLLRLKADIYKPIKIIFKEEDLHVLRYFFGIQGYMIHTVSSGFRYRLNGGNASIVARQANNSTQEVMLPVQNSVDLLILQIDTKRYVSNISPDLLNIPAELAEVFLNKRQAEYFFYHSAFSLGIFETLKELNEVQAEGLVKRFFIESKALELLWIHTENYKNEQLYGYDRSLVRKTDLELLGKAREFIMNNLNINLTLRTVARSVGTNETKLKNGLKILYGKTFGEILRNDRLTKARLLLEEGNLSIKETAVRCGYNSVSIFSKRFKEKYGVLPGIYLKSR